MRGNPLQASIHLKILTDSTTFNNQLGASLVAQMGKKLPAMQETPVQFLGQEDPLEKG